MTAVKSKTLGRDVLGKRLGKRKRVFVEEWGGEVVLRQLSHAEVLHIQQMASEAVDLTTQGVRDRGALSRFNFELIRASWVDEAGEAVLGEDDLAALVGEPNAVITTLVKAISDFNALTEAAQEDAKKNSTVNLNGASGTS
jgi:hypothetical protein